MRGREESSGARCHGPPWGMQARTLPPSATYQPPLHSCTQVEFPSCRLAQPLGFFLTRQQFYVRHHSTCPPPCLSSYFCSPSWWDLWPSCPLTPQSGLLLAPPMDQAIPDSSASDRLPGTLAFPGCLTLVPLAPSAGGATPLHSSLDHLRQCPAPLGHP